jgi:WD40 repeat protein
MLGSDAMRWAALVAMVVASVPALACTPALSCTPARLGSGTRTGPGTAGTVPPPNPNGDATAAPTTIAAASPTRPEEGPLLPFPARRDSTLPAGAILSFGSSGLLTEDYPSELAVDGDHAVTTRRKTVTVWSLRSRKVVVRRTLPRSPSQIALRGDALYVWEVENRKVHLRRVAWRTGETEARVETTLPPFSSQPRLVVGPKGARVAASAERSVEVWDTQGAMTKLWARRMSWEGSEGISERVLGLAVSEHGTVVSAGRVGLIDEDGRDVITVAGGPFVTATPVGIAFSTLDDRVRVLRWGATSASDLHQGASGPLAMGGDGLLWVHDFERNALLRIDPRLERVVSTLSSVHAHGMVGPTTDGVLLHTGRRLAPFGPDGWSPEHGADLVSVDLSADGRRLATRDNHGMIIVWNARTGDPLTSLDPPNDSDSSVALLQAPYLLAIAKGNMRPGVATLVNTDTGRTQTLSKKLFWSSADVASDGRHFMMGDRVSTGGAFISGRYGYRLDPRSGHVKRLGAYASGKLHNDCGIVGGRALGQYYDSDTSKTTLFWLDAKGSETLFSLADQHDLRCAPNGEHFVDVGRDEGDSSFVLDPSGKRIAELGVFGRHPWVAFSADGGHVAVVTKSRHVSVWSLSGGTATPQGKVQLAADPIEPDRSGTVRLALGGTHLYHSRTRDVLLYAVK